jgi:hypothetical protein
MQAVTMNTTLGLGLGLRARARVAAKAKATTLYGAPVVGKSVSMATRKATRPSVVVRAAAEPLIEAPFKGIKDDIANRTPVYLDDFKQGLNGKALVRRPLPRRRPSSFKPRDRARSETLDDVGFLALLLQLLLILPSSSSSRDPSAPRARARPRDALDPSR